MFLPGYFGRFTVYENDTPPYVVHNQEGRPRPAMPADAERLYLLDGDVLRLEADGRGRPMARPPEVTCIGRRCPRAEGPARLVQRSGLFGSRHPV